MLGSPAPGVVAYTATRWGALLRSDLMPPGESVPRASDCYRFALTHPAVDVCLAGPANGAELDEAMSALDRGPMNESDLVWMNRVGASVRAKAKRGGNSFVSLVDRLFGRGGPDARVGS
jgi:predicted aldo/keto reductase-like oxidoreductase